MSRAIPLFGTRDPLDSDYFDDPLAALLAPRTRKELRAARRYAEKQLRRAQRKAARQNATEPGAAGGDA